MSDAVLAALITAIASIIVALINRPPPRKRTKDELSEKSNEEVKKELQQTKYSYSVKIFSFTILMGAIATFSVYSFFNVNDQLEKLQKLQSTIPEDFKDAVNKRFTSIETELNENEWTNVSRDYRGEFDPNCKYRFRIINPSEGDEEYSQGYHYITTITPNGLWTSWLTNSGFEISRVNGVWTVSDGRFKGKDFILEKNCFN